MALKPLARCLSAAIISHAIATCLFGCKKNPFVTSAITESPICNDRMYTPDSVWASAFAKLPKLSEEQQLSPKMENKL